MATVAALTTHGMSKAPEHSIWEGMWSRCTNPKSTHFDRYGGRGITVDPVWRDFALFFAHVGPRPSPKHSIDRIDNDGNYEPGNVRWATAAQQAANRSGPYRRKTHCKWGHEFTEENTRWDKHGHRTCRTCAREGDRRRARERGVPLLGSATHCRKGHEMTPANTFYRPDNGARCCLKCRKAAIARAVVRQREKRGPAKKSPCDLNREKTHCDRGHPFDEANTIWRSDGTGRACRECRNERERNNRAKKKAITP